MTRKSQHYAVFSEHASPGEVYELPEGVLRIRADEHI